MSAAAMNGAPSIPDAGEVCPLEPRVSQLEIVVGHPPDPSTGEPGSGMRRVVADVAGMRSDLGRLLTLTKWGGAIVVASALGAAGMTAWHWLSTLHH